MADWTKLPFDLLDEIVMRFQTIEDLVYFSVVCRLWYDFATMVKHKFRVKATPWLLLAGDIDGDNPNCLRKVYNPFNDKLYQFRLPETFGCRCWGSSFGWLVTYNQYLDLHVFNPLTRTRISLPPITCLPYKWARHYPHPTNFSLEPMRSQFINNAFVIKVGENDLIVFVTYYMVFKKLAFARPGDQSWTSIDHLGHTPDYGWQVKEHMGVRVAEVICVGCQILILYEDASVGVLNISDLSDPKTLVVRDYVPCPPLILNDPRNLCLRVREYLPPSPEIFNKCSAFDFGIYFVHSCGDIFMVLRDRCDLDEDKDEEGLVYTTFKFKVYRLDFENKKWSKVDHFGDGVLFIGNSSSMLIHSIRAGECESKCIYYTDDYDLGWSRRPNLGGEDMGVYDLEHKGQYRQYAIEEECYTYSKVQTPIWFMPQF